MKEILVKTPSVHGSTIGQKFHNTKTRSAPANLALLKDDPPSISLAIEPGFLLFEKNVEAFFVQIFQEEEKCQHQFFQALWVDGYKDSQLSSGGSTQLSSSKHRQKVGQKIVQKLSKKSFLILSKTVRACLS